MIRETKFKISLTTDDEVDVKINRENGRITGFSVNYRTRINGKWQNVIRYDTSHSMIHVHRFWISTKPKILKAHTHEEMKMTMIEAMRDVKSNWERYRNYIVEKVRKYGK